jgi:CRP-like cAMP-binding protein
MENQGQMDFVSYKKDSYFILEGTKADCFYIIRNGKVRVSKHVAARTEHDEVLAPGDLCGVISTMSSHNHIETAQALTDVDLIAVQQGQYTTIIKNNTAIALRIITQFSKRLRLLNETLAGLALKNAVQDGPSHLFTVGEYYMGQKQYHYAAYAYTMYIKYCPESKGLDLAKSRLADIKKAGASIEIKTEYEEHEFNRTYPKGSLLFAEGEPGEELFIIQSGSVKVSKIVNNSEIMLAMLKTGDIVGEMAILEGKPRAGSVIANEDCNVMVVSKSNFEMMSKTQPQLIGRITKYLAERIWFIYKQLANALLDDPLARMYDALFIQLERNRVHLTSRESYDFEFGPKDLCTMVGLSEEDGMPLFSRMLKSKSVIVTDKGKIQAKSIAELVRQTESVRKMDTIITKGKQ